jgi:anti-sigma factor RsiW
MACKEFESHILDYLENELPPAARPRVEAHLAHCVECQTLAGQLRQLDAALASSLGAPTLPASFDARLRERLEAARAVPTTQELAERKRELQIEFETRVAELRRKSRWALTLLDGLGCGVLAGVGALLLLPLAPGFAEWGGALQATMPGSNLLVSSVASALFLLVGLGAAFQQPLLRSWLGR